MLSPLGIWLSVTLFLLLFELLTLSFIFLWFGAAAAVVCLFLLMWDISWVAQILIFSGFLLFFLVVSRFFLESTVVPRESREGEHFLLNRRGSRLIGKEFLLEKAIRRGNPGRISANGTVWTVYGPDCPVGGMVKVIEVRGAVLLVEPCAHEG